MVDLTDELRAAAGLDETPSAPTDDGAERTPHNRLRSAFLALRSDIERTQGPERARLLRSLRRLRVRLTDAAPGWSDP